jgi:hypothetical protein
MDSWDAIGKHWLQKYDNKFGVDFFFVNDMLVNLGCFPLNLPINNPFVFSYFILEPDAFSNFERIKKDCSTDSSFLL